MSFKEILEVVAMTMTITISTFALLGIFAAHKKGFFKSVHTIVDYYREFIEREKKNKPRKN
ncbi:MAG: hypothetical protein LBH81_00380 [Rickettsiales bacterium]|jgi:hypothetical protein|nr:hypothetical protein [Rickettsiales bacterium]